MAAAAAAFRAAGDEIDAAQSAIRLQGYNQRS
jgi:hypothetical protein